MEVTITIDNPANLEVYKHKPCTWNGKDKTLTFNVNVSPAWKCWRLAHKNGKIIDMFASEGITMTIWDLFTGTEDECIREAERLGLRKINAKV